MASQPFAGVLVPVLTPFTPSGDPEAGRFVAFCRWLLDQGADGLAIFGTTSEANSMAGGEPDPPCRRAWRRRRLDAAAVLLQGHERRRHFRFHLRRYRSGRLLGLAD